MRPRYAGIERADSYIVDPHKWLFAPAFFWEDVFSMLVLALHTAYLVALVQGLLSPQNLMLLALAACSAGRTDAPAMPEVGVIIASAQPHLLFTPQGWAQPGSVRWHWAKGSQQWAWRRDGKLQLAPLP